eukprot:COSAG02_NODE_46521_length_348_cov_0.795181_1_plen_30_part_01
MNATLRPEAESEEEGCSLGTLLEMSSSDAG